MTSSLGAMLRISLRRSRADWPIVLAAGLICLLAATLLAAGAIYASAVSTSGLHRVLRDAPADRANVAVSYRALPADLETTDATVTEAIRQALGSTGGEIVRLARSDSFALPEQPEGDVRNLAVLGYIQGLADEATLVDGAWPDDRGAARSVIPVAISESVAGSLGLAVGDVVALRSRADAGFDASVEVVATFRIDDSTSPFWWAEAQAIDGVVTSERFVTYGPFYASEADLLALGTPGRIELRWHALPDVDAMTVGAVGDLAARVNALDGRLDGVLGGGATVATGLPEILAAADRSLLVSRTGVLLLTVQLVVLAAYAVLLSASLLIEHRRIDTAMLRSRGAGPWRIVGLASIEAFLLAVPAALAAPWVAAAALRGFNLTGPLADIGLAIEPDVTIDAYVAAAAAALVCLIALTAPAMRSARSLSSVHGKLARGETAGIGQRLGIDIALLAVAGIGLLQLRQYGAPLTRSVQGTLGLDPLLVATPAIGLLAGGVVALRMVPLLAQLIERATNGGRGLVPSLGARQLARRPLRYTRAALLLMLAMAMGVFAVCYTWTWSASQRDQAGFQVGADVRVEPGTQHGSMPRWGLDRAYAELPGVTSRLPVDRETVRVSRTARGGVILGMDAAAIPSVARLREDLSDAPLGELATPLASARPKLEAVALPGQPRQLRLDVDLDIRSAQRQVLDEATGALVFEDAELADLEGWQGLAASVVVRDGRGLLHRFSGTPTGIVGGVHRLVVPLGDAGTDAAVAFTEPLDLLAVELTVRLPASYQTGDATLTVRGLASAGSDADWQPVALDLPFGWRSTAALFGRPHQSVVPNLHGPELIAETGEPGLRVLPGIDRFGRGAVVTFAPASLSHVADRPIPVVASQPFLDATAGAVGNEQALTIDGVRRTILVTAAVRAFPAADPDEPAVLMDLATLSLLRYEGNDAVEPAEEWWLAVDDASRDAVVDALRQPPIGSRAVTSTVERNRTLATDPVALGIIGALAIGFIAAALFAVVGFMVSAAVSARERITEFALLRALGLSPGQLSVWLSLENAALALVSLATGSALGLVIAWVVLPFITVTQGAATPFPPVEVDVPWSTIAVLEAVALIALTGTVGVLTWLLRRIGLTSVLRMSED